MKRIFIAGATGSIGTQTLEVIKELNKSGINYYVCGVSVHSSYKKLKEIIDIYHPEYAAVVSNDIIVEKEYNGCKIIQGDDSTETIIDLLKPDISIISTSGAAGIKHTVSAIKNSKRVGLANKESLVCGGKILLDLFKEYHTELLPVDSEHSAIYQLLLGESEIDKIIITASGGSLRDLPLTSLNNVSVKQVLNHPVWSMGKRITIDSATMVNKGLEIIEAYYLFNTKNIEVLINKNSRIHSMIQFKDGVIKMHYGIPTMKIPISFSITYPERLYNFETPDLTLEPIEFFKPDFERYPALKTAFEILGNQKLHIAYNAADEIAVDYFINEKIKYNDIQSIIINTLNQIEKESFSLETIEDVIDIDKYARELSTKFLQEEK